MQKRTKDQYEDKLRQFREQNLVDVFTNYSEYTGPGTKVQCRCLVCGFEYSCQFANLLQGKSCRKCSAVKRAPQTRLPEEVFESHIQEFKKRGIQVLTPYLEFKNVTKKVETLCLTCGRKTLQTFQGLQKGDGCFSCLKKKDSISELEFNRRVCNICEKKSIQVQTKYSPGIRASSRVDYECLVCGYKSSTHLSNLVRGHGCNKCGNQIISRKMILAQSKYEAKVKKVESFGVFLVLTPYSEYKGNSKPLQCKCLTCGQITTPSLSNLEKGNGCDFCRIQKNSSRQELEIFNFLATMPFAWEKNNRTVLDGLEIDLYCEELKIGIEYNGLYWHSLVNEFKHYNKFMLAKQAGVTLFQIFSDEWEFKMEAVKSALRGLSQVRTNICSGELSFEAPRAISSFAEHCGLCISGDADKVLILREQGRVVQALFLRVHGDDTIVCGEVVAPDFDGDAFFILLEKVKTQTKGRVFWESDNRYPTRNQLFADRPSKILPPFKFYTNYRTRSLSKRPRDLATIFDAGKTVFEVL